MKSMTKMIAGATMLLMFQTLASAQERFIEGVHYNLIPADTKVEPTSDKPGEVVEFFSYGCPHCYTFLPFMDAYVDQAPDTVNIIESPVSFGRQSWAALAMAKHIADRLDMTETMHVNIFKAVHEQGVRVNNLDDVKGIFVDNGVSAEDFDNAANSIQVKAAYSKSEQNARTYQVNSTPSIMVNGRYMVNSSSLNGFEQVFDVANFLLRKDGVELN